MKQNKMSRSQLGLAFAMTFYVGWAGAGQMCADDPSKICTGIYTQKPMPDQAKIRAEERQRAMDEVNAKAGNSVVRAKEEAERSAEDKAWATAQRENDSAAYRFYLSLYPRGRYAKLAQSRLVAVARPDGSGNSGARFRSTNDGVQDLQTGLLWAQPEERPLTWSEADLRCRSRGSAWRLPNRSELMSLFGTGSQSCLRRTCQVDEAIHLRRSMSMFWSSEIGQDPLTGTYQARYVRFDNGTEHMSFQLPDMEFQAKAMCVRHA